MASRSKKREQAPQVTSDLCMEIGPALGRKECFGRKEEERKQEKMLIAEGGSL